MSYTPQDFEKKWRSYWIKNDTYKVEIDHNKKKFYCLDMFPYPSGKGLHVGHPLGYIASDIVSRYKRMKGFNVLHPMGYDAFGLPAEQFAIQTGVHPADSTSDNISRYRSQLNLLGLSYDWSRSYKTCDADYYKWTQWIFKQMFDHYFCDKENKARPIKDLIAQIAQKGTDALNAACTEEVSISSTEWASMTDKDQSDLLMNYRLAYRSVSYVNWCEALNTVLANDEVKDGLSERGGFPVIKKAMEQWSLRTSAYADRLLVGLDGLEWSEAIKLMQKNWIGKSEGARMFFEIKNSTKKIEVFTTRPDTVFGVSFMVLAPELDLVQEIVSQDCKESVDKYIEYVGSRSERERMTEADGMTGAYIGAYAINPLTGVEIPVYISEYVLKDYGTGAIMAVPDGDSRDLRFAEKFDLSVPKILEEKNGKNVAINSDFINGMEKKEAIATILDKFQKSGIVVSETTYRLRDANFSRQRYWGEPFPIYYDIDGIPRTIEDDELPLILPSTDDFLPSADGQSPLAKIEDWVSHKGGRMETDTMPGFAASSWYYFRYMDPKNENEFASKEALDYWNEVDLYIGGAEHAVGHLLYSRMWCKFLYDINHSPVDEPFRKLVNQGMIQGRSNFVYRANEKFAESYLNELLKSNFSSFERNVLIQGADGKTFSADFACTSSRVVIELRSINDLKRYYIKHKQDVENTGYTFLPLSIEELFYNYETPDVILKKIKETKSSQEVVEYCCNTALFVSNDMVTDGELVSSLYVDVSLVSVKDILDIKAFEASRIDIDQAVFILNENGEYLCGHQVEKMSKSKYNVVSPDEVVERYGADCFRLYEMFLGPLEQSKPWDTQNIGGVSKFLRKFYHLFYEEDGSLLLSDEKPNDKELKVLHQTIKKLEEDIEKLNLNTCISAMMIAVNELTALNCSKREILEPLTKLLSPFAPHLAEELWQVALGHQDTVVMADFPIYEEKYLVENSIEYPLCVNGKKRTTAQFDASMSKDELEKSALENEDIKKWLEDKTIVKVIVVPNRMINFVVR